MRRRRWRWYVSVDSVGFVCGEVLGSSEFGGGDCGWRVQSTSAWLLRRHWNAMDPEAIRICALIRGQMVCRLSSCRNAPESFEQHLTNPDRSRSVPNTPHSPIADPLLKNTTMCTHPKQPHSPLLPLRTNQPFPLIHQPPHPTSPTLHSLLLIPIPPIRVHVRHILRHPLRPHDPALLPRPALPKVRRRRHERRPARLHVGDGGGEEGRLGVAQVVPFAARLVAVRWGRLVVSGVGAGGRGRGEEVGGLLVGLFVCVHPWRDGGGGVRVPFLFLVVVGAVVGGGGEEAGGALAHLRHGGGGGRIGIGKVAWCDGSRGGAGGKRAREVGEMDCRKLCVGVRVRSQRPAGAGRL